MDTSLTVPAACSRLGSRFAAFFGPARGLGALRIAAIPLLPVRSFCNGVYSGATGRSRTAGVRRWARADASSPGRGAHVAFLGEERGHFHGQGQALAKAIVTSAHACSWRVAGDVLKARRTTSLICVFVTLGGRQIGPCASETASRAPSI